MTEWNGYLWPFLISDTADVAPLPIEAGKFLQDQVKAGNIVINKDANNAFGIGNSAGLLQSTGSLGGLAKSAQIPFVTTYLPGPKPGACAGGAGLAIPNKISDERKVNAVKFVDFLTNTQNTIMFTQATGYMPVRKDAVDDPAEAKYLEENPNAMTAIKQLAENTAPQDYARVFVPGGGKLIGGGLDRSPSATRTSRRSSPNCPRRPPRSSSATSSRCSDPLTPAYQPPKGTPWPLSNSGRHRASMTRPVRRRSTGST